MISSYIRKEAVSSSRIEGTQSDLDDLFAHEVSDKKSAKTGDVREVENYVKAMEHGLKLVDTIPISLRLNAEPSIEELRESFWDKLFHELAFILEEDNFLQWAFNELKSCFFTGPSPYLIRALMAVGAV